MALELYYTDRVPRTYTLAPKAANGQATTITAGKIALVPPRAHPTAATTWTNVSLTNNAFTVDFARPGATDTSGALLVPDAGADVYIRGVSGTYDDAELAERIIAL